MTKAQEEKALNGAKEAIRDKFKEEFGFAPAKKDIIPLEASYNNDPLLDKDFYYCESLGFRIGGIGYSYRIGEDLEKAEWYNA